MGLYITKDGDADMNLLASEIGYALEECGDCLKSTDKKLLPALNLWNKFTNNKFVPLPGNGSPPFFYVVADAMKRLGEQLCVAGQDEMSKLVKEISLGPALEILVKQYKGGSPDIIDNCLDSLKACHALNDADLATDKLAKEDPESIRDLLPRYVKVNCLESKFLSEVCEAKWNQMCIFLKTFEANLRACLDFLKKILKDAQRQFQDYRQGL